MLVFGKGIDVKKYIKVHREYDQDWVDTTTCDICKKEYRGENWERENYSSLETEVRMKTGYSYPDSGSGEEMTFDICPDCFKNKLIPLLLKEFGASVTITDWDF